MSSLVFQVYSKSSPLTDQRVSQKYLYVNAKSKTGFLIGTDENIYMRLKYIMALVRDSSFQHEFTCYGCLGIFAHKDENSQYKIIIFITERYKVGFIGDLTYYAIKKTVAFRIGEVDVNIKTYDSSISEKLSSLFSQGNFYYAEKTCNGLTEFSNISLNNSEEMNDSKVKFYCSPSNVFLWNIGARKNFKFYEKDRWIAYVICGSVAMSRKLMTQDSTTNNLNVFISLNDLNEPLDSDTNHTDNSPTSFDNHRIIMIIITRISWKRPGLQTGDYGINEYGRVSSFMETEQIVSFREHITSYVQVRGSVPIFWTNFIQGDSSMKSIKITRDDLFSFRAMRLHFLELRRTYPALCCLSILGDKNGELLLSDTYQRLVGAMTDLNIPFVNISYYKEFIGRDKVVTPDFKAKVLLDVTCHIQKMAFFASKTDYLTLERSITINQLGCVRINCNDSLEKSNLLQSIIGLEVLKQQLEYVLGSPVDDSYMNSTSHIVNRLWVVNGTMLTQLYTSSTIDQCLRLDSFEKQNSRSSYKSSFKKKVCYTGGSRVALLSSLNSDYSCLSSPEMIKLGLLLPPTFLENTHMPEIAIREIANNVDSFVKKKKLSVTCATWNVGGGLEKTSSTLIFKNITSWLLYSQSMRPQYNFSDDPIGVLSSGCPDILVIGFQEIIDLTAKHAILNKNVEEQWKAGLQKTFKINVPTRNYVLLASRQLFGIAIFVYIIDEHISIIKEVDVSAVKTGFKGKIGTKGATLVSLNVAGTSICFVSSHLAAGQKQGCVDNRNNDFATICSEASFSMYDSIYDHDFVFWMGDLNYRVELPYQVAKAKAKEGAIDYLLSYDQLMREMNRKKVFHKFKEGKIRFPPTYKFDKFTDIYDTSDKQRTPSFTDRILWFDRSQSSTDFASQVSIDLINLEDEYESITKKVDDSVELIHYGCADLRSSDHKPLVAEFVVPIAQLDACEFKKYCIKLLNRRGLVSDKLLVIPLEDTLDENQLNDIGEKSFELFHIVNDFKVECNSVLLQLNAYCFQDIMPKNFSICGIKVFTKQYSPISIVNMDWQEFDNIQFYDSYYNNKTKLNDAYSNEIFNDMSSVFTAQSSVEKDSQINDVLSVNQDSKLTKSLSEQFLHDNIFKL